MKLDVARLGCWAAACCWGAHGLQVQVAPHGPGDPASPPRPLLVGTTQVPRNNSAATTANLTNLTRRPVRVGAAQLPRNKSAASTSNLTRRPVRVGAAQLPRNTSAASTSNLTRPSPTKSRAGAAANQTKPKAAAPRGPKPKFTQEELRASDALARNMSVEVLKMMHHAWDGYKSTSWGMDEASPVTGRKRQDWLYMGATIVDAFSTLWLMSLKDKSFVKDVEAASDWLAGSLRFDQTPGTVSFFETTIRVLGGLNAAHSLTGNATFLRLGEDLGTRLLRDFGKRPVSDRDAAQDVQLDRSVPGFPGGDIDLKTGQKHQHSWSLGTQLAEAGTNQLEFRYLTQQSGEARFAQRADYAMESIFRASGNHGLCPRDLDPDKFGFRGRYYTIGAGADSYFEYLSKVWVQSGKVDKEHIRRWKLLVQEMIDMLVRKDIKGNTFVGMTTDTFRGMTTEDRMEHLGCYLPGNLIYTVNQLPPGEAPKEWADLAAELAATCHQMYVISPIGLGAESYRFDDQRGLELEHGQMILRPEAIESWYYMWYYTGDPKYRRWAADTVKHYNMWSKQKYGYSPIPDVRRPHVVNDNTESFFFAETLKYLFLIFQDRDFFSLDEWVLNTEAHPVRVVKNPPTTELLGRARRKGRGGRKKTWRPVAIDPFRR